MDLAGPGVGIVSTVPGGYATFSGTSMATSHVSGVVALLVAQHPEYSAPQLVQRVLGTTKPLSGAAAPLIPTTAPHLGQNAWSGATPAPHF